MLSIASSSEGILVDLLIVGRLVPHDWILLT